MFKLWIDSKERGYLWNCSYHNYWNRTTEIDDIAVDDMLLTNAHTSYSDSLTKKTQNIVAARRNRIRWDSFGPQIFFEQMERTATLHLHCTLIDVTYVTLQRICRGNNSVFTTRHNSRQIPEEWKSLNDWEFVYKWKMVLQTDSVIVAFESLNRSTNCWLRH